MKLQTWNAGPMRVMSKDGPNEYMVQRLGEAKRVKPHAHVERMGPYLDIQEKINKATVPKKDTQNAAEGDNFEVERIVADKGSRAKGSKQFLIKWKGYSEEGTTWEPLANLQHCSQAVTEYEMSKGGLHMEDLFTEDEGIKHDTKMVPM